MYSTHSLEDDDEKNDPTGRSSPSPSAPELCHKKSTSFNTSIVNNSKIKEEDPLAEFYAQAKAEHEIGVSRPPCDTLACRELNVVTQWLPNGDGHDSELTPSDVEIEEPVKKTVAKRVCSFSLFCWHDGPITRLEGMDVRQQRNSKTDLHQPRHH